MWAVLRLESEHLHNTEGFRRVDVIPLHFDHRLPPPSLLHRGFTEAQSLFAPSLFHCAAAPQRSYSVKGSLPFYFQPAYTARPSHRPIILSPSSGSHCREKGAEEPTERRSYVLVELFAYAAVVALLAAMSAYTRSLGQEGPVHKPAAPASG